MLFNPGDSHACVQSDGGTFDYRGVNISKESKAAGWLIPSELVSDITSEPENQQAEKRKEKAGISLVAFNIF